MTMASVRGSVALFAAASLALLACDDALRPVGGCATDDDCLAPRTCDHGLCVDPAPIDAGDAGDVSDGSGDASDGSADAPVEPLPDVPEPRLCLEAIDPVIDFGTLAPDQQTARRVRLANCGRFDVSIASADFTAGADAYTFVTAPVLPLTVPVGGQTEMVVVAAPNVIGGTLGTLTVGWGNASATDVALSVTVEPTASATCLRFVPSALRFGTVGLGAERTAAVQLENCGTNPVASITVTESALPAFVADIPEVLDAGASAEVIVRLTAPESVGPVSAGLGVGLDGETLARVGLVAEVIDGDEPCVVADPAVIDFGVVTVGESVSLPVTLTNCGAAVDLSSVAIESAEFSATLSPQVLPVEGVTEVVFTFTPTAEGLRGTGWRLGTADGIDVGPFGLFGVGEAAVPEPVDGPAIALDPTFDDVGDVSPGSTQVVAFSVCNIGDELLLLDGADFTGDLSPATGLEWTVAPVPVGECIGGTALVTVPGLESPRTEVIGEVRIRSNARNQSVAVFAVRGAIERGAPDHCLELTPTVADVTLSPAEAGAARFELRNCGQASFTLGAVTTELVFGTSAALNSAGVSPGPGSALAPGATATVDVSLSGESEGSTSWRVIVSTADGVEASAVVQVDVVDPARAPCVALETPIVEFVDVPVGTTRLGRALFRNCGEEGLEGFGPVQLAGDAGFALVSGPPPSVAAGAVFEVTVSFAPEIEGEQTGALTLVLPDGSSSERVDLRGNGVPPGVETACLAVDTTLVDFGSLSPGSVASRTLNLRSCGTLPVTVDSIGLRGGSSGFSASLPGLPLVVGPGEAVTLNVSFGADSEGTFSDALLVLSDAVEGGSLSVRLTAVVTDGSGCPVASIGVSTNVGGPFGEALVVRPGTSLFLDAAFDVGTARVEWTLLDAPAGASRRISVSDTGASGTYTPTVEGTYVFGARWVTAEGCSGEGSVFVDVRAASGVGEGLRVVITWRTPGDPDELTDPGTDIDLHFARPNAGGNPGWNSENDCYYGNRTPAWGGDTDTTNDPRLLRDELDGLGPEILVLENPSEPLYWVAIHYFSDDGFGASDVTVRFYLDGIEFASDTRRLENTGDVWVAAAVRGTLVDLLDYDLFNGFPVRLP